MMIGRNLGGRYEIVENIGTGGMADVYKAYCTKLNRYVAIKVLKKEFSDDKEFVDRFNLESQAAAGISHSNIVSVYDVGCENGIHYIVMELVEGVTLKEYINTHGMLPWRQVLDFSLQICDAMAHAHREGIVHRDIKPHNIMVTSDNILKVMDFGIARTANKDVTSETNTAIGTVHYISPEQARGGRADERSDIYSMGIVIYEMLTGKVPFDGDNAVSIAIMHMQNAPVPPRDIVISIPYEFEAICLKAMAKNPSDRYSNTDEFLADLRILDKDNVQNSTDYKPVESYEAYKPVVDRPRRTESDKRAYKEIRNKPSKTPVKKKVSDKRAKIILGVASAVIVLIFATILVVAIRPAFLSDTWIGDKAGIKSSQLIIDKYPNLVGRDVDKIVKEYENNKNINIVVAKDREESVEYDEGKIISQNPKAGTKVTTKKITITVVVSKGKADGITKVPNLVGKHYKDAVELLEDNDIDYKLDYSTSDKDYPKGFVISQTPKSGSKLTNATTVKLYVNKSGSDEDDEDDENKIEVPDVEGFDFEDAKKAIEDAGLEWGTVTKHSSDKPVGVVISLDPAPGSKVNENSRINIIVSSGASAEKPDDEPEGGNSAGNNPTDTGNNAGENPEEPDIPEPIPEPTPDPAMNLKTQYISVALPQDGRDNVNVSVKIDGQVVHTQDYNTANGEASVRLTSSGTKNVEVYIDGTLSDSIVLEFNE